MKLSRVMLLLIVFYAGYSGAHFAYEPLITAIENGDDEQVRELAYALDSQIPTSKHIGDYKKLLALAHEIEKDHSVISMTANSQDLTFFGLGSAFLAFALYDRGSALLSYFLQDPTTSKTESGYSASKFGYNLIDVLLYASGIYVTYKGWTCSAQQNRFSRAQAIVEFFKNKLELLEKKNNLGDV